MSEGINVNESAKETVETVKTEKKSVSIKEVRSLLYSSLRGSIQLQAQSGEDLFAAGFAEGSLDCLRYTLGLLGESVTEIDKVVKEEENRSSVLNRLQESLRSRNRNVPNPAVIGTVPVAETSQVPVNP